MEIIVALSAIILSAILVYIFFRIGENIGLGFFFNTILSVVFGFVIGCTAVGYFAMPSYDRDGYKYIVSNLKSPSSAKVLSYKTKKECKKELEEKSDAEFPEGMDFEYYNIEAENSFGGRVTNDFVVVYLNDVPIYFFQTTLRFFYTQDYVDTALREIRNYTDADIWFEQNS